MCEARGSISACIGVFCFFFACAQLERLCHLSLTGNVACGRGLIGRVSRSHWRVKVAGRGKEISLAPEGVCNPLPVALQCLFYKQQWHPGHVKKKKKMSIGGCSWCSLGLSPLWKKKKK